MKAVTMYKCVDGSFATTEAVARDRENEIFLSQVDKLTKLVSIGLGLPRSQEYKAVLRLTGEDKKKFIEQLRMIIQTIDFIEQPLEENYD